MLSEIEASALELARMPAAPASMAELILMVEAPRRGVYFRVSRLLCSQTARFCAG
jgi:hypothetical protein